MRFINFCEQKHRSDIDEKYHQLNLGNIGNVIYWWQFFNIIKNINGDIVECGIGRGRSLLIIAAINNILEATDGGQRHIFGYDSFEGFPYPTSEDNSLRNPQRGEWSNSPSGNYKYSEEFTKLVLKSADILFQNEMITLTKGFFSESLPLHPDRPIALLHVDGDLYQSYLSTLKNLFHKVVNGGIVVFDDFRSVENDSEEPFPGARKAVKEFFGNNFEELRISMIGTYYMRK